MQATEPSTGASGGEDNGGFGYFDNLWNWLSSIVSWLRSCAEFLLQIPVAIWDNVKNIPAMVWDFVKEIPGQVWGFFENAFSTVTGVVQNIFNSVVQIPNKILDGLKWLFIPSEDEINKSIQTLSNTFKSTFGVDSYDISDIFGTETEIADQQATISVGGYEFNLTVFNVKYLVRAISTFRPVIRGFIVFLLILYNINQLLALIRQNPIAIGVHLPTQPSSEPLALPSGHDYPLLKG